MHGEFYSYTLTASKAVLILLSFAILIRCLRSMLREKYGEVRPRSLGLSALRA